MNNKNFVSELSQRTGYTQDNIRRMLNTVIDSMNDSFQKGEAVTIPKFGTFEVKKRQERILVNPGTKQRMLVPPKLILNFKPVMALKEKMNNGGQD